MIKYIFILGCIILAGCNHGNILRKTRIMEGPGVITRNGMVVSAQEEASKIGLRILQEGGNATDAAVATGLALAVCFPEAGNIGGGGFMVFRFSDGTVNSLDYREKAPAEASGSMYLDDKGNVVGDLSTNTRLSSGIPGSVAGMIAAHDKYGTLDFHKVIQPAIDLAEKGFAISKGLAFALNANRQAFLTRNTVSGPFVKDSLWKEGDILIQHDLAETLKLIRDKGSDGFYKGPVAANIIREMQRGNGIITGEDLETYKPVWRKPLTGNYRNYRIITIPLPSSGGIILLQVLSMIEGFNTGVPGFHTSGQVHLIAEAERRSFADRAEFLGDPDFVEVPVHQLLDRKYLKERMGSFNPDKASLSSETGHGDPTGYESPETTHYSVVDGKGNAVSVTTTLNNSFGNSIIVQGSGFLLNDEMDDFSVKPGFANMYGLTGGEANSVEPGKRMLSSMTPTIVEKDGNLFMVLGSPGGSTIPTSVAQVIINCIDYDMNIQDAVDAGRFYHQWLPDILFYERNSLDSTTIEQLNKMGYKLIRQSAIGRINAIMRLEDGSFQAGADARGNNVATGY
jgi:gamma-glutamyltranspeptidase/glutathione hydrolase